MTAPSTTTDTALVAVPHQQVAILPTYETKVATPPIAVHQDVVSDEHLVRIDLTQDELRRLITQIIVHGGIADIAPLAHMLDQLRRDRQQRRPHDAELHDAISGALTRIAGRVVERGGATWHITPEAAETLADNTVAATEEPDECATCGRGYTLPDNPYCGACEDSRIDSWMGRYEPGWTPDLTADDLDRIEAAR